MKVFKKQVSSQTRMALLLGALLAASALVGCSEPTRQRKNVKDLTSEERSDYVQAVLKLKSTPSPIDSQYSWYDQFVAFHQQAYLHREPDGGDYQIAHESPTFLPWHRKLLLMYEDALREVSGKDLTLPYWDWADPSSQAAVFTNDFMGPGGNEADGYVVTSGPFRKDTWENKVLTVAAPDEPSSRFLVRRIGLSVDTEVELPTPADMEYCLERHAYDVEPWDKTSDRHSSFRNCVEGWGGAHSSTNHMHNVAHIYVGGMFMEGEKMISGSMASVDTSPNDPVFFLHHANVDRLWALWEERHGNGYLDEGQGYSGWSRQSEMHPFTEHLGSAWVNRHGVTPGDMLDTRDLGYEYR